MLYRKTVLVIFESDPKSIYDAVLFGIVVGPTLLTLHFLKNFGTAVSQNISV